MSESDSIMNQVDCLARKIAQEEPDAREWAKHIKYLFQRLECMSGELDLNYPEQIDQMYTDIYSFIMFEGISQDEQEQFLSFEGIDKEDLYHATQTD